MDRNAEGVAIVALCPALGEDHFGGPAHATIVFCGEVSDVSLRAALAMESQVRVMAIMQGHRFTVPVVGEAMFGQENNERVLLLPEQGTPLTSMRMRTAWMSRSQFTQYRPHVATDKTVESVTFVGLALWYGTKQITYPFLFPEVVTTEGESDGSGDGRDDEGGG